MLRAVPPQGYRADADTGVLVPTDIARKRVRFSHNDTGKIDAATRTAKKHNLMLLLACAECGPSVKLRVERDMETGFKKLICSCTERILTGGV